MDENNIKILAISGSVRDNSSNSKLLRAVANLSPENVVFKFYNELETLPHFNPGIDNDESPPAPVTILRNYLKEADGVLFSTPEYANGVPGVLKNALDWIVSSGEFMNKPVAVISASPHPGGGEKAHASLLLTLNMLSAKIVEGGTMMIPFITTKLNADGKITDPVMKQELINLINALVDDINKH
jgi:chromate reductase